MLKSSELEIRRVKTYDEYKAIAELQKEVWGQESIEIVPPSILMVNDKIGGIVAGAFTAQNDIAAFVYGLPGFRAGEEVHWSHMLAVKPSWRGLGLGAKLKEFQKEFVLSRGIKIIHWTYDPLESVNARLNLKVLGALPVEYVHDLYGKGEKGKLHRGIGTDRFIVSWFMDQQEREAHLGCFYTESEFLSAPAVISDNLSFVPAHSEASTVLVEIPDNIQEVKDEHPDIAALWRASTRAAFDHYMAKGFGVVSYVQDPQTAKHYYVLSSSIIGATSN